MGFSGGVFTRTDGTRTGSTVWAQAKAAAVKIISSAHDTHDQAIADGLSTCLLKDGTQTVTANIPMSTFKITGLGNATAAADAMNTTTLQAGAWNWGGDSTGAATVFAVTLSPAITSYTNGMTLAFKAHQNGSAGVNTINVNGVGSSNIYHFALNSTTLLNAEIATGQVHIMRYLDSKWYLMNPYTETSVLNAVTATGTNQAGAVELTGYSNLVTVSAAGNTGVKLQASAPVGRRQVIYNADAADTVLVYPPVGESFDNYGANNPYTIPIPTGGFYNGLVCHKVSSTLWLLQ